MLRQGACVDAAKHVTRSKPIRIASGTSSTLALQPVAGHRCTPSHPASIHRTQRPDCAFAPRTRPRKAERAPSWMLASYRGNSLMLRTGSNLTERAESGRLRSGASPFLPSELSELALVKLWIQLAKQITHAVKGQLTQVLTQADVCKGQAGAESWE